MTTEAPLRGCLGAVAAAATKKVGGQVLKWTFCGTPWKQQGRREAAVPAKTLFPATPEGRLEVAPTAVALAAAAAESVEEFREPRFLSSQRKKKVQGQVKRQASLHLNTNQMPRGHHFRSLNGVCAVYICIAPHALALSCDWLLLLI
mmetsp:Transcript_6018/g.12515  ORF Transcript_6018/g.12515 Transcript_6018/m.12515 type:complete len:147 (-) Transcript_6018:8-448(-)